MDLVLKNISLMQVNGLRLELPTDVKFDNYAQVKNTLVKAGGKYVKNGFEFKSDPQEIVDRLCGGEKVNPKKTMQFFPTPEALARRMVIMAGIESGHSVLEPSAGSGNIVKEICLLPFNVDITVVELDAQHTGELMALVEDVTLGDFLDFDATTLGMFDRIVANPPFTNNQDIQHVKHMHSLLYDGGRIVTLMSPSWVEGSQKMQQEFREWLYAKPHTLSRLPSGTFKDTAIEAMLVVIDKR